MCTELNRSDVVYSFSVLVFSLVGVVISKPPHIYKKNKCERARLRIPVIK